MIPVRLTLLLIGFLGIMLLVLGNPEPVAVSFLFWSGEFELYKIIIASFAFGAIFAVIYTSQVRYLKKVRSRFGK